MISYLSIGGLNFYYYLDFFPLESRKPQKQYVTQKEKDLAINGL